MNDRIKKNEADDECGVFERQEMYLKVFFWEIGKVPLGKPRCRWRIILEWIINKSAGKGRNGLFWFRIGTRGGLL
jgi:hypothetical protein